jgi:hypothetical protein
LSNSTVSSGTHLITFTGVIAAQPNVTVTIQALQSDGTFLDLASAPVPSNGQWSVDANVSSKLFYGPPCGRALFRAMTSLSSQPLTGVKDGCLNGFGPNPNLAQIESCTTTLIAVQLDTPAVFTGDVTLVGQDDAAIYKCVT